jgi:hypothetical protein
MSRQKITRRQVLKGAAAAGALGALGAPAAVLANKDKDDHGGGRIRWDIVNILPLAECVQPGGHASARAQDGARITVTGSGTFPNVRNRCSRRVTGGGTWTITPGTSGTGCFTGSGTFRVTELLKWDLAPGVFPVICDDIGAEEDFRAGLAKLRVRYSNETTGVLTVSCHGAGTPDCVFEGITASMDYEDFWNAEAPDPGPPDVDANRTAFHVVRKKDDEDGDDDDGDGDD